MGALLQDAKLREGVLNVNFIVFALLFLFLCVVVVMPSGAADGFKIKSLKKQDSREWCRSV